MKVSIWGSAQYFSGGSRAPGGRYTRMWQTHTVDHISRGLDRKKTFPVIISHPGRGTTPQDNYSCSNTIFKEDSLYSIFLTYNQVF